jgi:hypothetical protein
MATGCTPSAAGKYVQTGGGSDTMELAAGGAFYYRSSGETLEGVYRAHGDTLTFALAVSRASVRGDTIVDEEGQAWVRVGGPAPSPLRPDSRAPRSGQPAERPGSTRDDRPASGAASPEDSYVAAMKSDLRNLVTAQEAYFSNHVAYTDRYQDLGVLPSAGVRPPTIRLTGDGWTASVGHTSTMRACAVYVGSTRVAPAVREGEPDCGDGGVGVGGGSSSNVQDALVAAMISDLRNLVIAEARFFAAYGRYAEDLGELRFVPSPGVRVLVSLPEGPGYIGTALDARVAMRCDVMVGPAWVYEANEREGEPRCVAT